MLGHRLCQAAMLPTLLAAVSFPQGARADVGFLYPSTFHAEDGDTVTAIASFSDRFPHVEHPLRSQDFHILLPDGERQDFDSVHLHDQLTVLTAKLSTQGVYRLSSGQRLGRKGEVAIIDGAYMRLGPDGLDPSELPEDAPILSSQTATVSEVFVRHGDVELPDTLTSSGRLSLALHADSQKGFAPNAELEVSVHFDGKPLTNAPVTLATSLDAYTDHSDGKSYPLNTEGQASFVADQPGPHVVFVRHIAAAPDGSATDIRSYTTALVFELSD